MSLLDERTLSLGLLLGSLFSHAFSHILGLQLLHLLAVVFVERHIVVANEVIALLAACLGCLAVAPLEPCEHRLADVYASVVHDVGLHHAVAVGLHDLCERPAEQVVAHMSEVERLVGVGRRILNHDERRLVVSMLLAEGGVSVYAVEQREPCCLGHGDVEEALHDVEFLHRLTVLLKPLSDLLGSVLRLLVRYLEEWEHYEREATLKLALGLLQLHHLLRHILSVKLLHGFLCREAYFLFDVHNCVLSFFVVFFTFCYNNVQSYALF